MMEKLFHKIVFMIAVSVCLATPLFSSTGHLLIVGGGKRPQSAMEKFVEITRGGDILVITSASEAPQSAGTTLVAQLLQAGAKKVSWMHIADLAMANADSVVAAISSCKGIFFSGGVQERIMVRLGGSRSENAIWSVYRNGGIIGGTSAGAAVMSEIMITGRELLNADSTNSYNTIRAKNIETAAGLGFLKQAIVDQHFVLRKRNNRLLSVVLEHPHLLGIGIDESTAILVSPNNKCTVFGIGTVLVYDARKAKQVKADSNGLLRARGVRLEVLTEGDQYNLTP